MNLTIRFEGHVADVIDQLIAKGVVATKTEALRLGGLRLGGGDLGGGGKERRYDEWAIKEVERQDKLVKEGKMKTYTEEEFLKMFPHLKKIGKKK